MRIRHIGAVGAVRALQEKASQDHLDRKYTRSTLLALLADEIERQRQKQRGCPVVTVDVTEFVLKHALGGGFEDIEAFVYRPVDDT